MWRCKLSTNYAFVKNRLWGIHTTTTGVKSFSSADDKSSISSHKCEVNGYNIHFERTGVGKHVMLLMPGAIGSSRTDFMPQLEHLDKERLTVIGWDPPGYGQSRPPARTWPKHFFERDADVAAALMKKQKYNKFSLLGWSDGGITAMVLAAKYPELVTNLILWGANSYVTKEEIEMYDLIRDTSNWSTKMREPFVKLYGEKLFQQLWIEWIEAVHSYYQSERKGNFCDDVLNDIICPTLIINGEKDVMVPQFHVENLKNKIKNNRVINYADGKHNLHLKYFKEFNKQVEDFVIGGVVLKSRI